MSLFNFRKNRYSLFLCSIVAILFWELHFNRYYNGTSLLSRNEEIASKNDELRSKTYYANRFKIEKKAASLRISKHDEERLIKEAEDFLLAEAKKQMIYCKGKYYTIYDDTKGNLDNLFEMSDFVTTSDYTHNNFYRAEGENKNDAILIVIFGQEVIEHRCQNYLNSLTGHNSTYSNRLYRGREVSGWKFEVKNNKLINLPSEKEIIDDFHATQKYSCSNIPSWIYKHNE